ncbi:MAG: GIY-YIG nuclease family protein [Promethearchaeota archaeon]
MYYVYMLKCTDKYGNVKFYTGYTNSLNRRLAEHGSNAGARFTRGKILELVFYQTFRSRGDAMRRELEIKHLSRKKKEELIEDIFVNEKILDG